MSFETKTYRKEINRALCKDRQILKRWLYGLPSIDAPSFTNKLRQFEQRLTSSRQKVSDREGSIPEILYPKELPISGKSGEIIDTIRSHQVVIITGETGSGKTTQIPKMCLAAGRGVYGKIACTQPRRIAATSLCQQVAKEMMVTVGAQVGYKIRFGDKSSDETLIQFVTDGLLLAEIQRDRFLNEYDTIIIDEAHERTLNIDFLLGYIKQLLSKRPELKLIVTSATIDVEKFSRAFPLRYDQKTEKYIYAPDKKEERTDQEDCAPIISVSGRMYPVELRYRPIDEEKEEEGDQTMIDMVQEAVEELLTETAAGDILVFMSGIQEIREARDMFRYLENEGFAVLPLFGQLSNAEQNKIFKKNSQRKIILSTNIAETSITVPGIRFVVDTGRARISQYNTRSGTQGLPIKAISQSSADQRKGRCGRVSNGICIRLYSEEDFTLRNRFTVPEIQRSNLSDVILRLLSLRLGEIETFPFIDPPESAQIRAGFKTLKELGALNDKNRLTPIGKEMSSLPVDPRTARMVLQANHEKAVYPVLVIASAISCQDPRERPEEMRSQADQKHARFKSRESDLMTMLQLWEAYHSTLDELKTQGKMRKFCKSNFLSYNKIREWRDIHAQLTQIAKEKGWNQDKPDNWDYDAIHRSILAGFLTHIAKQKEKKIYQGTRNRELMLFPGSDQYQSRHEWIVATDQIETSKLYAHRVAKIDPDWLESLAGNLIKKSWSNPHWEKKGQRVVAFEKITLFGFVVVEQRKVFYGKVNREESNQIFVREALVEGNFESDLPFWKHNRRLIRSIEKEEAKARVKNLLIDDETMMDFYLQHISGVACLDDLKKLIKKEKGDKFLFMTRENLLRRELSDSAEMFPSFLKIGETKCRLEYLFEPGHPKDGLTLHLPWNLVGTVRESAFEYLVPGLLKEKILWCLKNLPKEYRKKLVPIPEKAEKVWDNMTSLNYSTESEETPKSFITDFYEELSTNLFKVSRVDVPARTLQNRDMPDYLRMNFSIKDPKTKKPICGRSLKGLLSGNKEKTDNWQELIKNHERYDVREWDFGTLLEKVQLSEQSDIALWGYKTLKYKDVLLLSFTKTYDSAVESYLSALPKLIEPYLGEELAWIYQELRFPPETLSRFNNLWNTKGDMSIEVLQQKFGRTKQQQQHKFHEQLQQKVYHMVYEGICGYNGTLVLTEKAFLNQIENSKRLMKSLGPQVTAWINQSLELYHQVLISLHQKRLILQTETADGFNQEINQFFSENCLELIPLEQWRHLPRIFKCYLKRLDLLAADVQGETSLWEEEIKTYQKKVVELSPTMKKSKIEKWAYLRLRWMLEEFKVSTFAQSLSTAFPISRKRLDRFINDHIRE